MSPSQKPIRGQLLHTASDIAWRYRAYNSYDNNPATACRALAKRCPGFTKQQYLNAFQKNLELYDTVEKLVAENASRLWAAHKSGDDSWPKLFDQQLKQQFSTFNLTTLRSTVNMMFYYWHLR